MKKGGKEGGRPEELTKSKCGFILKYNVNKERERLMVRGRGFTRGKRENNYYLVEGYVANYGVRLRKKKPRIHKGGLYGGLA